MIRLSVVAKDLPVLIPTLNPTQSSSRLAQIIVAAHFHLDTDLAEFDAVTKWICDYAPQPSRFPSEYLSRITSLCFRLQRCKHGLTAETCVCCKAQKNPDYLISEQPTRTLVMGPWITFLYPPIETSPEPTMVALREYRKCAFPRVEPDYLRRVVSRFGTALDLAEYAARHKNNEDASVPHLPNRCDACQMHVTSRHDFDGCAAKLLVEQKRVTEMQAARREAREQRYLAAIAAQRLTHTRGYSADEDGDLNIIEDRHGVGVFTEFDKQLWNKSKRAKKCKWRIQ